jgi:hypothetical protein
LRAVLTARIYELMFGGSYFKKPASKSFGDFNAARPPQNYVMVLPGSAASMVWL